jgi:hypothetical protein
MVHTKRLVACLFPLTSAVACSSASAPPARLSLAGTWAFAAPAPPYTFTLSQTDSTVSGRYLREGDPAVLTGPVVGRLRGTALALGIDTGAGAGAYRARFVTPTRLDGTLTSATGDTVAAVLKKLAP